MAHDRPTEPLPRFDQPTAQFETPDQLGTPAQRETSAQRGTPARDGTAGPRPGVTPRRRRIGRALVLLLALAVVGALAGWGVSLLEKRPRGTASTTPVAGGVVVPVTVTSLDPVGGSGFQRSGEGGTSVWRTQTYTTADFGRLKRGVGLVLDLGSPHALTAVTFDVTQGPVTVELRTTDAAPSPTATGIDATTRVGAVTTASGPTTLAATGGGSHRWWVVWVTRLGARDGGFGATLSQPVSRG